MQPKIYTELFTETEGGIMCVEAYWGAVNYDSALMPIMPLDAANDGYDAPAIATEKTPTIDENGYVIILSSTLSPLNTGSMSIKIYLGGRNAEYQMRYIVTLEVNGKQVYSFDDNRYFTLSILSDGGQADILYNAILAATHQFEDDYESGAHAEWFGSYECESLAAMGSDIAEKFGLE